MMSFLTCITGFFMNFELLPIFILVGSRDHRTQIWKGTTQESFQQSLVEIGSVVSQPRPPFKMAAVTKNRNFFNCPLLL
jgi:hypothetical protein